jgi:hypothetical protein
MRLGRYLGGLAFYDAVYPFHGVRLFVAIAIIGKGWPCGNAQQTEHHYCCNGETHRMSPLEKVLGKNNLT